jgi:hypothetical protein
MFVLKYKLCNDLERSAVSLFLCETPRQGVCVKVDEVE